jgi:DNA-binding winged helix-turn-helix (wHTH) protein
MYHAVERAQADDRYEPEAIEACDVFQEKVENEIAREAAGPPAEILGKLGPKEAPLLLELWNRGSVTLDYLSQTVWKDCPVEPASIIQCVKRLRQKISEQPWQISMANGCITLDR